MALVFALLAAASYATSSVLEQRAATTARGDVEGLRLLGLMLRTPRWLAGWVAGGTALLFQTIAFAHGSFILVQAVVSTGLLFAFGLSAATGGPRPRRRDWLGAVAAAGGVALFLGFGTPHGGRDRGDAAQWAGTLVLAAVAIVAARELTRNSSPRMRGGLLGAAAGLTFALDAGLLKSAASAGSVGAFLGRWELYGFLVAACLGNMLILEGFRDAPLTVALPALTVTEPVAAIVIGMAVFGERMASSGPAPALELLGLSAMITGLVALSRLRKSPVSLARPSGNTPHAGPLPAR